MTLNARFLATTFASMLAVSVGTGGLAAAVILCATGSAHAAGGHDHSPKHGGVVAEAGDLDFELVAKADLLTLYIRDHGKPLDTKGASGKITLLAGTDKVEAALASIDGNTLQAKGAFKIAPGTKAVASVTLPGKKSVTTRFVIK